MSTKLEELRQEKADVLKSLEEIDGKAKEENRPYNDDEIVRMDSGTTRVQSIEREIETLTRSENLKQLLQSKKSQTFGSPVIKVSQKAITPKDHENAFKAWLCADHQQYCLDKYLRAAELCGVDPSQKELYVRAQSTDTTGNEGEDFLSDIARGVDAAMKNYGKVEAVSSLTIVPNGEPFHDTLYDDTDQVSEKQAQNADGTGDAIEFEPLGFKFASYKTRVLEVSLEALEDVPDLVNRINDCLGIRQARKLSAEYSDGTSVSGAAGCGGYRFEAGEVDADSTSNGITVNDLLKLWSSVDADYREGNENCVWTMNDATLLHILQNAQTDDGKSLLGDWISGPSMRILGHRVIVNNSLDGLDGTSESSPVTFGDMSRFRIYRTPVRLVRTDNGAKMGVNLMSYVRASSHIGTLGNAINKLVVNG